MKITLKIIILVFLVVFNLVIIISNFTTYEGLEGLETNTTTDSEKIPKKEKSVEELQASTEPTKEDIKYGIVGEGDMAKS